MRIERSHTRIAVQIRLQGRKHSARCLTFLACAGPGRAVPDEQRALHRQGGGEQRSAVGGGPGLDRAPQGPHRAVW